jgi:hypothetical protein
MTIDGTPPNREDVSLNNLNTEIRYEEVIRMLSEEDVLPPETLKENEGTFSIEHEELAKQAYNVILELFMKRAEETNGWNNGRNSRDPRYKGESVAEAAGDRIPEVSAEKASGVMQKIMSNVENGFYEDQYCRFEVKDTKQDPLPASAFR